MCYSLTLDVKTFGASIVFHWTVGSFCLRDGPGEISVWEEASGRVRGAEAGTGAIAVAWGDSSRLEEKEGDERVGSLPERQVIWIYRGLGARD